MFLRLFLNSPNISIMNNTRKLTVEEEKARAAKKAKMDKRTAKARRWALAAARAEIPVKKSPKRRTALVKKPQSRGVSSLRAQYGGRGVPKGNMIFDSFNEVDAFDSSIGGF